MRYWKPLLFIILILVTISLIGVIFYIDHQNPSNQKTQAVSDLKGYNVFIQKFDSVISLDPSTNTINSRAVSKINLLENKSISKQEKYQALLQASQFIELSYSMNHNHKFLSLLNVDFDSFAKNNFKEFYKTTDFQYPCQDPTCADAPAPKEILKIIDEINASTIPDDAKKSLINDLQITTYISKDSNLKGISYLTVSSIIRADLFLNKAGLNNQLADELDNFIKNNYPDVIKK